MKRIPVLVLTLALLLSGIATALESGLGVRYPTWRFMEFTPPPAHEPPTWGP
ncbi:MAG TPA: hypothetical protein VK689_10685 [Armatimonadota bacterium]|jgi:hypothetical protein|nr:hypothetical protein [Armatimonadota bacterium]